MKNIIKEDMICPITNKHCYDECCSVGSECNISGGVDKLSPSAPPKTDRRYENNKSGWIGENYDLPPAPIKTEGEDEWKDVDSAPKDRTEILGYDYNTESIYIVLWCPVLGNGAWILPTGNYLPRITHWRPLPNKPGESGPTPNELNLLKETVNNQHALILSAEQRGYEKAKQELSAPPSPVGIELVDIPKPIGDFIIEQKDIIGTMGNDGMYYHYSQVCILLNRLKASLPQSSTEEEKDLWLDLITEVEMNEFLSTKYKEVIDKLQSTYKISKR